MQHNLPESSRKFGISLMQCREATNLLETELAERIYLILRNDLLDESFSENHIIAWEKDEDLHQITPAIMEAIVFILRHRAHDLGFAQKELENIDQRLNKLPELLEMTRASKTEKKTNSFGTEVGEITNILGINKKGFEHLIGVQYERMHPDLPEEFKISRNIIAGYIENQIFALQMGSQNLLSALILATMIAAFKERKELADSCDFREPLKDLREYGFWLGRTKNIHSKSPITDTRKDLLGKLAEETQSILRSSNSTYPTISYRDILLQARDALEPGAPPPKIPAVLETTNMTRDQQAKYALFCAGLIKTVLNGQITKAKLSSKRAGDPNEVDITLSSADRTRLEEIRNLFVKLATNKPIEQLAFSRN